MFRTNTFRLYLLLVIGFGLGVLTERFGLLSGLSRNPPSGIRQTFEPFWETWNLVDKYYVDRQMVQPVPMTRGAIQGMLASLGDTGHTTYLTPDEVKEMIGGLEGHLDGIGARMSVRKKQPTIVATLPGSPARAAGLRPGDVLSKVNGRDVHTLSLTRIVEMVRGPAGTTVHLEILRAGGKRVELDIVRARVNLADVSWHLLPGTSIAHLAIYEFGVRADEELRQALGRARAQGSRGLIIDVRGDPGGVKDQAVAVTSEFIDHGTVFIERDAEGKETPVEVRPGGQATELPICLLVDEGTASAAEIFAGAIQSHHRGKLVGMRTFGTGTVLKPFNLSDGSAVLLAVMEWLTPDGQQIWHHGIKPDVEISLPEGAALLFPDEEAGLSSEKLAKSEDRQLLSAMQVMKEQLGTNADAHPAPAP